MSTTTEPTPPASAPPTSADLIGRPIETAPSRVLIDAPTIARGIGFLGLFLLVLGIVVVVLNMTLSPRWIGKSGGYIFAAFGIALMLYHAMRDAEQEVRRIYGIVAAVWLVLGVVAALTPGPVFESALKKETGYNLLPGVGFGFLSLLFVIPFVRQETEAKYHDLTVLLMLVIGVVLSIGSLLWGVIKPDFLVGSGIGLSLLGLAFLCAYMAQTDTSEGIGYSVAFLLGAVGGAVTLYALGRATILPLLYEGPNALKLPNGNWDHWKAASRAFAALVFAGIATYGIRSKIAPWARGAFAVIGLAGVAVLLLATVKVNVLNAPTAPNPFLVPGGLVLIGLGLTYFAVSLGICSDNQFVTLTRRELAAYFLSPIGYLVLAGTVLMQWISYWVFVSSLMRAGTMQRPIQEPIVSDYFFAIFPVLALLLEVPALTMRLVAEEKRTGSMEVLLTAPVNEVPIVLSKFLATWLFFMVSWLPAGLFLIALRVVVDQPFDYRPLLSFYIAFGAQGLAFIAIGLFFSTLTKNQIVAAVLTLVGMLVFLLCYFLKSSPSFGLPPFIQAVVSKLSFISMWSESLEGRLPLRDTLIFASLGLFFLFLSVKVLETRKWS